MHLYSRRRLSLHVRLLYLQMHDGNKSAGELATFRLQHLDVLLLEHLSCKVWGVIILGHSAGYEFGLNYCNFPEKA